MSTLDIQYIYIYIHTYSTHIYIYTYLYFIYTNTYIIYMYVYIKSHSISTSQHRTGLGDSVVFDSETVESVREKSYGVMIVCNIQTISNLQLYSIIYNWCINIYICYMYYQLWYIIIYYIHNWLWWFVNVCNTQTYNIL